MQFLDFFPPNPGDEKLLGYAAIRYNGWIYRYKLAKKKDGSGWFPAPANLKIGDDYFAGAEPDSKYEDDKITKFIRDNVKSHLGGRGAPLSSSAPTYSTQQSVFEPPLPTQEEQLQIPF